MISEREEELPGATIVKLLKIAEESKNIISLGPGEPDFEPDLSIIKFAKKKLDQGYTHYSPSQGREELLEALCKKLKKENKIKAEPEQIIVTCGSQEAIFLGLMCMVDPGEHVLVPDPGFLAYRPCIELLNGAPVAVKLDFENGFQPTYEALESAMVNPKRTRVLIINTPSNPTGTVFKKKTLEEIADFVVEYDLIVFSDEAYEHFVYKGKHISIASLNGMEERVVSFFTFSKSYGMPGFRVGYAVGPNEIIKAMVKVHPYTTLCAPTISQLAALAALKLAKSKIMKIVREYNRRRKFIVKRLNEIEGFECMEPEGAFYAFPKINFGLSSLEFCEWLLKEAKVACVPGTEFGKYGEGFVRFSYATRFDLIEKAMDRIEKAVKKLR
jgi:aminotransferase